MEPGKEKILTSAFVELTKNKSEVTILVRYLRSRHTILMQEKA